MININIDKKKESYFKHGAYKSLHLLCASARVVALFPSIIDYFVGKNCIIINTLDTMRKEQAQILGD